MSAHGQDAGRETVLDFEGLCDGALVIILRFGEETALDGGESLLAGLVDIPGESLVDVVGGLDELSPIRLDEPVAALRLFTTWKTWDGQKGAVIVDGVGGGVHGAALDAGLDNKSGVTETSNDAITRDKIIVIWFRAKRELSHERPTLADHLSCDIAMLRGVDTVKTMSHDSNGWAAAMKCGFVSSDINTESETRDNDEIRVTSTEIANNIRTQVSSAIGGATSPDYSEHFCRLEIDITLDIKGNGAIGAFLETTRVVVIVSIREDIDTMTFGESQLCIGELESNVTSLIESGESRAVESGRGSEVADIGIEGILGITKKRDETTDDDGSDSHDMTKSYEILGIHESMYGKMKLEKEQTKS